MEETLHALGGILLRAIPTFLLVILLHLFLKYGFFRHLDKILQARYEATEGARKRAAEMVDRAASRIAEYEAAMRSARADVYKTQEQLHVKLEADRKADMASARAAAEETIRQARAALAADVESAKKDLGTQSDRLAGEIADVMLGRSAA